MSKRPTVHSKPATRKPVAISPAQLLGRLHTAGVSDEAIAVATETCGRTVYRWRREGFQPRPTSLDKLWELGVEQKIIKRCQTLRAV